MQSPRVFATCNIGDQAIQRLRDHGYQIEVYEEIAPPPLELILSKVRSGVDALITTLRDPIGEEVFRAGAGTLKVVAQDAVGYDNIDRQAANHYRIPFTNTADVLTHATAEFAFLILGSVARKLHSSEQLVREHRWTHWHPFEPFLGTELTGKTIGIVGTGRIGRAFALKCTGFELDILLYDVRPDISFSEALSTLYREQAALGLSKRRPQVRYVVLEELLGASDFVSLHVPLTRDTHYLIDEAALRKMKSSAFLINTSRGPVVHEASLHRALAEGWIAGAALDVFESEPLPDDSPLRDPALEQRLRLFHHFASGTGETRLSPDPDVGMAGRCIQGVIDVLQGRYGGDPGLMPFVVNKEAFEEAS